MGLFITLGYKLKYTLISVFLTAVLSLIILAPSFISASNNAPVLFHKGSSPYGTPYSEWLKNWWQWWLSIPNDQHPFPKYDPKTCSVHQQGPVWYLPDVEPTGQLTHASVTYSCEIPKGKAIFFPLSQSSCWLANPEFKKFSNKLAPNPESDQALKTCAVSPQDFNHSVVKIDGVPIDPSKLDRVTTNFYNVTVPPIAVKGLFDFGPPGTSRGIADGYVLFVPPLPVGKHTIEFTVTDHLAGPTSELIKRDGTYIVSVK
jgi:hypothetical protein